MSLPDCWPLSYSRFADRAPGRLMARFAPRRVGHLPMQDEVAVALAERQFTLASSPPGPAQKRFALVVALALLAVFVLIVAGPLSKIQTARIDAFVPIYLTAMFANDSITAVLLFAQFSIQRSRALLWLANGYLFTALMLIPYI